MGRARPNAGPALGELTVTDPIEAVDAEALTRWIRRFAELVAEHRDELTALDSAIGDADHGTNMDRGMTAVVDALAGDAPPAGPGALLKQAGMTLVRTVGGASGPLYGTFFLRMAPAVVRTRPGGVVPFSSSSFSSTAVKPRSMFVPWSASPIAASSCVR